MNLDDLLLWLSTRRAGSWAQFRGAVERLQIQQTGDSEDSDDDVTSGSELSVYHQARSALQCLAHVEFNAAEDRYEWRIVPPSLAFLPDGETAVLCGARSDTLLERLHDFADVDALSIEGMPQRIAVRADSVASLVTQARAAGLHVQEDAPTAILCALPRVRDLSAWPQAAMPKTPGWQASQFLPWFKRWTSVSQDTAVEARAGLFRFAMKYQRSYYVRHRGRSYRVPVQIGKYAVMGRRQGGLSYNAVTKVFSAPPICRPPLLLERALVLCSGYLPRLSQTTGRLEYSGVPQTVSRLAAQLLSQEIR